MLASIASLVLAESYDHLANVLLGAGLRPFDTFTAPADMSVDRWYSQSHLPIDLAQAIVVSAPRSTTEHKLFVEMGSFHGNSAVTWARALVRNQINGTLVCMDTWLGDAFMWDKKGAWLSQDRNGVPRIYEQFMLNVRDRGVSHLILPLRLSATVGMSYLQRRINAG